MATNAERIPNVEFVLPALTQLLPLYEVVDDCVDDLVKGLGTKYLPMPNPDDKSPDNLARFESYNKRAVFYNVTGRTLNGLTGQIYSNEPEVELPGVLDKIKDDSNGKGVSLVQSSKAASDYVLRHGRCGLYIDYPKIDRPATKLELDQGLIKPSISVYAAKNIINWRLKKRQGKWIYSLIVLVESYDVDVDGFEVQQERQYRVLTLINDIYTVQVWRNITGVWQHEDSIPVDSDGKFFNEIPFTFIGAVNNDPEPDQPPLYPLAVLNISHYCNSADYEESCFLVGQPLYVVTGITQEWLTDVLKGKILSGSRGGLPLPVNANAEILQPAPNIMPFENMQHKEKQMVAIGAKLIEDKSVQQTATEATIHNAAETSILATIANNVSAAFKFACEWAGRFVGVTSGIAFKLNTDFAINKLTPQERTALMQEWQANAITFSEYRQKLKSAGIATLDDEEAQKELDQQEQKKQDNAASAAKKLAEAVPQPLNKNVKPN